MAARGQINPHPILFAIYPVVFLYSANTIVFDFSVVFLPALANVALAALAWTVLTRVFADSKLAAVFTSLSFLAFFSYGAIEQALRSEESATWPLLIATCVALAFGAFLVLLKWRQFLAQTNYFFNIVSLLLVTAPLFQIGMGMIGTVAARGLLPERESWESVSASPDSTDLPDIYYFILDGYGRDDVLHTDYGLDNQPFLADLEKRGFYIAREAVSNYPSTLVSITSTMNFSYLDEVFGTEIGEIRDRRFLRELMQKSRGVRLLKSAGYSVVSFSSEYSEAQIGSFDKEIREWWFPSQFVIGLAQMTPIPSILGALDQPVLYDLHRYRTLYPMEHMEEAAAVKGPKFVYSHLYFAHPPFVFGAEGERVSKSWDYTWDDGSRLLDEGDKQRTEYVEGYRAQVAYLNKRLLETIDVILASSKRKPIIIIHGDHGGGSRFSTESLENTDVRERYSIFYGALLPDGGEQDLYPSISPINGMRVIFNRYLGSNFPLLEDASYFNAFLKPYHYERVDDPALRVSR